MNLKRVFWSSITACVVLTLLLLNTSSASAALTDGLAHAWTFNENSTNLVDYVNSSTFAKVNSPSWFNTSAACKLGGCYNVSGAGATRDTLTSADTLANGTNTWTFVTWANFSTMDAGGYYILSIFNGTTNSIVYLATGGVSAASVTLGYSGGSNSTFGTIPNDNTYHLYFLVHDRTNSRIYLFVDNETTPRGNSTFTPNAVGGAKIYWMERPSDGGIGDDGNHAVDDQSIWLRQLTYVERLELWNNGAGLGYPFTGSVISSVTLNTPVNNSIYLNNGSVSLQVNTLVANAGGGVSQTHFLYNNSGALVANRNGTGLNFTSNWSLNVDTGRYFINASFTNGTVSNFTGKLNITIYNITNGSITAPLNGSSVASQSLQVNWTNLTFNPTGVSVLTSNFTLSLYNSTTGFVKQLVNTTNLTYSWSVYAESLATGTYYLRVTAYDNQSNSVNYTDHQINITTNALLNLTARSAVYNNTITIFNASIVGGNINTTLGTTTGLIQIDIVKNVAYNVTIFYTNITTNSTLYSTNLTHNQINYTLYWLNSLNIYFYDESTLTLLNNNTVISLDLISDDYSSNYTVINGSIQINLLTPETYVSRYSSTGYTERFYVFTVTNDTYQILNLYLRNDTDAVLVQVKNAALQVVEGAVVKAQKKIPATNEHITVEIGQTDSNGEILMSLSLNDEFYRFIVSVDDVIKLTTNDAYIIDEIVPLYLPQEGATGEEPFQYLAIDHTLTFSTSNNRFLFSFNDGNNLQKDYCIKVRTQTGTYNTSCQTDVDAGSMSIYVTPVNGTTYVATTYVYFGESEIPLGTLSYAFQENPFEGNSTQIQETNKLLVLIQVIISIIFIYAAMQTMPELIPLAFGISLILGRVMLLTQFEWWIINAVAFACLVLSAWLGVKKDG